MDIKKEKKSDRIEEYYEPKSPKNDFSAPLVAKQSRKVSSDEAISVTSGKGDRENSIDSPMTRYRDAVRKQGNIFAKRKKSIKGSSY